MNTCLILLTCLIYNNDTSLRNYKSCAIDVSQVKKVHNLEIGSTFIEDFGEVKDTVAEIAEKVNACNKKQK